MTFTRRQFVTHASALVGAWSGGCNRPNPPRRNADSASFQATPARRLDSWEAVRAEFLLSREAAHFASCLIASHPTMVREAIERHRRGLDADPCHYIKDNHRSLEEAVLARAAQYLEVSPSEIALTDSTTMGLGLVYQGFKFKPGQEVLITPDDHASSLDALQLRAQRGDVRVRYVTLFENSSTVTEAEVVSRVNEMIDPATRMLAATWVHSNTGVKLPLRAMANALAAINTQRDEENRVLLCVDGVHGFAVEQETMADLGCDCFVAGCHKWLYGPRGTGFVWAKPAVAAHIAPIFPTMSDRSTWGGLRTPGGFHSFEHRWALKEAFDFHLELGKERVTRRTHELNTQLKKGLSGIDGVTLHTPLDERLSSGLVCFDVRDESPAAVVERLWKRGIIISQTPYQESHARFAAGIVNSNDEVERALDAVRELV